MPIRPIDPLQGASDVLAEFLATQPILRWWTLVMLIKGGPNPWNKKPARHPDKRTFKDDMSSGERIDVTDPASEQSFQSLMWGLKSAGWSITAAYYLVMYFHTPGTRWINSQPDPDREFTRSWLHADVSVGSLRASNKPKTKFKVYEYITDHVWAYVLNHPGVGVKAMRADTVNLLPGARPGRRNGLIDAARAELLEKGLIRVELQKFGKKAHYSTVDKFTGEIVSSPVAPEMTSADLDLLFPPRRIRASFDHSLGLSRGLELSL
ncbi:MAG: hypothetical protein ACXWDK_09035 [Aeromicrobium sp.]